MPSVPDVHPITNFTTEPWDPSIEFLFKEAKQRQRRRRTRKFVAGAVVVGVAASAMAVGVSTAGPTPTTSGSTPLVLTTDHNVKVVTCSGASVVRPRTLIVTCADANTLLTSTTWSTWTAKGATGTTTFGMNLCTPYCAASPISYFPRSSVRLSAPVTSRRGTYFSRLAVRYVTGSTVKTFDFSWQGDPAR